MAQLIVRNVDEEIVRALKMRAARKRHSAEAEHREILREALAPHRTRKSFKEALLEMPSIGVDLDFDRPRDVGRKVKL